MEKKIEAVLHELNLVLKTSDFSQIDLLCEAIISASNIILFGAGRVGLAMKAFSMRLSHLGFNSYFLNDSNIPNSNSNDLLIVGSGSGNTGSVLNIALLAKKNGLNIVSITSNKNSLIAKNSSVYILLNCQHKETKEEVRTSIQPMTTLFEQALFITLDAIVLVLMQKRNETHYSMLDRHNNLE